MSLFDDHTPERSDAPRHRSAAVVVGLVLVALAAMAGGGWWWLNRRQPAGTPEAGHRTARPAPTSPHTATGTIEIEAAPGAAVAVDGKRLGHGPQRVELGSGPHAVRVEMEGVQPFERDVHVVPGRTVRLTAHFEAEAPSLRVDADVPGATVFLDRKPVGRVPVELHAVSLGSHRLNVTADGYEMYSETLDVEPGPRQVMVRFKEVRLDETLPVVHKHTVGSCQGRLVANVGGLRYETPNTRDAFQAPLTALEPIQADYLQKNLRVKVKGGKTYNFTSESAEALLSFQKAVEAARQRL